MKLIDLCNKVKKRNLCCNNCYKCAEDFSLEQEELKLDDYCYPSSEEVAALVGDDKEEMMMYAKEVCSYNRNRRRVSLYYKKLPKFLVERPDDTVIVTIIEHKLSKKYSFVNLTYGHICECKFDRVKDAIKDLDDYIRTGKVIRYKRID